MRSLYQALAVSIDGPDDDEPSTVITKQIETTDEQQFHRIELISNA